MSQAQRDIALNALWQVRRSDPYGKAWAAGADYGYAQALIQAFPMLEMFRLMELLKNAHSMAIAESLARRAAA